ncbi:VOC family protein, partial [Castellaniella defragrans]|nr:catechol 2,3-dioxygenase-like lactoylglutathione lyase family enzyme [Castellaniella defragrans]
MKPRVTVITLGVDDLERSLRFYRDGLGLATEGIIGEEFEDGAVAFFDLQPGLKLAVWPRASLAKDSGLPLSSASATEFSLVWCFINTIIYTQLWPLLHARLSRGWPRRSWS